MNLRSRALLIATLVIVAACAGATIANVDYDISYTPGEELSAGNNVPVMVIGDPFPTPQQQFAADVVDAMQGSAFGSDRFVVATDPSAAYRVIMVFNPSDSVTGETLCTVPPPAQAPGGTSNGASVPLSAALCRGNQYLAYAYGTITAAGGPQSRAFRRGISQFTEQLFPGENPQQYSSITAPPDRRSRA